MDTINTNEIEEYAGSLMGSASPHYQEVGILLHRCVQRAIDFGHVSDTGLVSWSRLYALTERDDVSGDLHAFALRDAKMVLSVWNENKDN